jgi:hypothetical protein
VGVSGISLSAGGGGGRSESVGSSGGVFVE